MHFLSAKTDLLPGQIRAIRNQPSGWEAKTPPPPARPDEHPSITTQCIELPALCKSKKTQGTDSVKAQADQGGGVTLPICSTGSNRAAIRRCVGFSLSARGIRRFRGQRGTRRGSYMQRFAGKAPEAAVCNSLHSTFVPRCGIFPCRGTHLTTSGAPVERSLA
jgi:hypothetical protein